MLPRRLAPDTFKVKPRLRSKRCGVCGNTFNRPGNYSHAQWEAKTFCSNACAQHIPMSERLYSFIAKDGDSGCWNWTGVILKGGYGRIVKRDNGKRVHMPAHRAAYLEWVGPIREGLMVLHGCDNARCVNPEHLRLGTHDDNMADKVARQRCRNQYGRPKRYAPE